MVEKERVFLRAFSYCSIHKVEYPDEIGCQACEGK